MRLLSASIAALSLALAAQPALATTTDAGVADPAVTAMPVEEHDDDFPWGLLGLLGLAGLLGLKRDHPRYDTNPRTPNDPRTTNDPRT